MESRYLHVDGVELGLVGLDKPPYPRLEQRYVTQKRHQPVGQSTAITAEKEPDAQSASRSNRRQHDGHG